MSNNNGNAMVKRLLGSKPTAHESYDNSTLPVLNSTTSQTFRSRNRKFRQGDSEEDTDSRDSVKRVMGESTNEISVIPDDAEPVDDSDMVVGKPLRAPKEVVQEPSYPADKESYQTPYAALTAPDVTPQSTQPIDPSEVPGAGAPEKFTAKDLENAELIDGASGNTAADAMNVLLGRTRTSKPATQPGEFEQAGAVATEEQAASMLGILTPLQENAKAKAANSMVSSIDGGAGMPAPAAVSDGSKVYGAFRKFVS